MGLPRAGHVCATWYLSARPTYCSRTYAPAFFDFQKNLLKYIVKNNMVRPMIVLQLIKTKKDYQQALKRLEQIFDAKPNTVE